MKRLLTVLKLGRSPSHDSSGVSDASPGAADPASERTSGVQDDGHFPGASPEPPRASLDKVQTRGGTGEDAGAGAGAGTAVALEASQDAELANVIEVLKGRGLLSTVVALEIEVQRGPSQSPSCSASAEAAALLMSPVLAANSSSPSVSGCNDSPEGSLHNLLYRSDGGSSMSATPPSRHTHSPSIDLADSVFLLPDVRGEGDSDEYGSDADDADEGRAEEEDAVRARADANSAATAGAQKPRAAERLRDKEHGKAKPAGQSRSSAVAPAPAPQRRGGRIGSDAYYKKPDSRVDEYSHGDDDAGYWRESMAPEHAAMVEAYFPGDDEREEPSAGSDSERCGSEASSFVGDDDDEEEVDRAPPSEMDDRELSPVNMDGADGLSLASLSLGGANALGLGGLGFGLGVPVQMDVSGRPRESGEETGEGTREAYASGEEEEGVEEDKEDSMYSDDEVEDMFDTFMMPVLHNPKRTGFEEHKDFPIYRGKMIAGRYRILGLLGSAAFSRAVHAVDTRPDGYGDVCIKIIKNNKEFFDQSLDEIKLLKLLSVEDPQGLFCALQMHDYFYHKEHLFLVCELLKSNLHDHQRLGNQAGEPKWFTLPRLQRICRQVLTALSFVHDLGIIHCDLKPENILIESFTRCLVKVIDFGSSCYTTDHLSSYVQSRSYRAPEVMLGHPYDQRVDIWSLGCILAEMDTGYVLFQNDSISSLFARIVGILGPIDPKFLAEGRHTKRHFAEVKPGEYILYHRDNETGELDWLQPKRTSLRNRLHSGSDLTFVDFLSKLLTVDPRKRPTAREALMHPWLRDGRYPQEPDWGVLNTYDPPPRKR